MFYSIHQSYNRIKLKTIGYPNQRDQSVDLIVKTITELPGVEEITFRESTGSLIIHYDPSEILSYKIINLLSSMGYLPSVKALPLPFVKTTNMAKRDLPIADISKILLNTFLNEASKNITDALIAQTGRILVKKLFS